MRTRTRAIVAGAITAAAALAIALILHPTQPAFRARVAAVFGLGGAPAGAPASAPGRLPELPATGWIHGGPMPADSLRGHVVVLVLFSDTHPSAVRTLPGIQAWHEAYARFGVRVIGVHLPEYAFATHDSIAPHVAARLGLTFPIVRDPTLRLLAAFGSRSSEVEIVIADAEGRVRHAGAAGNAAALAAFDHTLRELLRGAPHDVAFPAEPEPPAPEPDPVRTVRLGAASIEAGPLAGATRGRPQPFTAQFRFEVEGDPFVPHPVGWWTPRPEGIEAHRGGAAQFVAIRYDARRVGVVASPPPGHTSKLWVLRNEAWLDPASLGDDARLDAHGASYVEIDRPRLYFVARGAGWHVLKLSPEAAGLTLHALTFEGPSGAIP